MTTVRPYSPVKLSTELKRPEQLLYDWSCQVDVRNSGVRATFERHYDIEDDEVVALIAYETCTDGLPWSWSIGGATGGHEATVDAVLDGLETGLKEAKAFTLSGN